MGWIALVAALLLGVASVAFVVLAYRRGWQWTGLPSAPALLGKSEPRPAKTLWDWLQLFVVPLALAALAVLFTHAQSDRDQRQENARAKGQQDAALDAASEDTLRAYIAQMTELMLHEGLLKRKPRTEVSQVARTATLSTVRRLDGPRKGYVVGFLFDSGLLIADHAKVGLYGADLTRANLRSAILFDADLNSADLTSANLSGADLSGTVLRGAVLRRADLRRADLTQADLNGAHLDGADLRRANLHAAKLGAVDLRGADLRRADLRCADLRRGELDESAADIRGALVEGADLRGARGVDLRGARGKPAYASSAACPDAAASLARRRSRAGGG
jgi:uncharacterized protein YjbI with pentapeptide repeats